MPGARRPAANSSGREPTDPSSHPPRWQKGSRARRHWTKRMEPMALALHTTAADIPKTLMTQLKNVPLAFRLRCTVIRWACGTRRLRLAVCGLTL
jgi:hypothetical protein